MSNISRKVAERLRLPRSPLRTVGFTDPAAADKVVPFDPQPLRGLRLQRVQAELRRLDYGAAVFFDPLNVRYATGTRNMSVWLLHNLARYCFVPAEGKPVLFEFPNLNCQLNARGNDTLAEVRPAKAHLFTMAAEHRDAVAERWAQEITDLLRSCAGGHRLAVDRLDPPGFHALHRQGLNLGDGQEVAERARLIKSAAEIELIDHAVQVAEQGVAAIQSLLQPGVTENELWAELNAINSAAGGEWIETRLLSSGPRTNPWFQECSERAIQPGDMVSLDTDMIGPHGYCADISRAFVCGPGRVRPEQADLYALAHEQVQHNAALLGPGVAYRELAEKAWRIPAAYRPQYYGMLAHGVGLADEGPVIAYDPADPLAPQGVLQPGMCICVESYIGASGDNQGVKLEQQYAITSTGARLLGRSPLPGRLEVVER
jgi:Xaa-Pro aminopeptidase